MTKLIGSSKSFRRVLDDIAMIAPVECCVLIKGETGTGKELVARAIHQAGPRRHKPFIALNCAAIPASLLESELFGHEKGAFTGAISQTVGKFQAAHGGTLFLDEIGDMPLELQPKILRVLQEQQFERIGSIRTTQVDVRVIAATHAPLSEMVEKKAFRADLFYRLNVFPLLLPALKDRGDDIPELVVHFLRIYSEKFGRQVHRVSDETMEALKNYHWPGNIRELQNFIERSVITTEGATLTPRLSELTTLLEPPFDTTTLFGAERAHIIKALDDTNWIVGGRTGAAARLGLPRTTLLSKMQRLGLARVRVARQRSDEGAMIATTGPSQSSRFAELGTA